MTNLVTGTDETEVVEHGVGEDVVYLKLEVPDYEKDVPAGATLYTPSKTSRLHLGDDDGWADTTGDDLFEYFTAGGFIDDTRRRQVPASETGGSASSGDDYGAAIAATPPNESEERTQAEGPYSDDQGDGAGNTGKNQAVTDLIPDYVGWRDHTDGHRISTTRGDKIEVIGGNWKLVSLGRGTGEASLEMSGGVLVDGDIPPGGISSVTWQVCTVNDDYGWRQVEQTANGNFIERFHGSFREEFYGDKLVTIIGSPDENPGGIQHPDNELGTWQGIAGLEPEVPSEAPDMGFMVMDEEPELAPTHWDPGEDVPDSLQRPDIYNGTWAKGMHEYLQVKELATETRVYKDDHYDYIDYDGGNYICETILGGLGKTYRETWRLSGSLGFQERFYGAFTQMFFGASTTLGFANRFEFFLGTEQQVNVGHTLGVTIGSSFESTIGNKIEYSPNVAEINLMEKQFTFEMQTATGMQTMFHLHKSTIALMAHATGISSVMSALANKMQGFNCTIG